MSTRELEKNTPVDALQLCIILVSAVCATPPTTYEIQLHRAAQQPRATGTASGRSNDTEARVMLMASGGLSDGNVHSDCLTRRPCKWPLTVECSRPSDSAVRARCHSRQTELRVVAPRCVPNRDALPSRRVPPLPTLLLAVVVLDVLPELTLVLHVPHAVHKVVVADTCAQVSVEWAPA